MHADATLTWLSLSLLSFVLSWSGVWLLLRRCSLWFIDLPNQRSSHTIPTPRGGGVAFVAAFFLVTPIAALVLPAEASGACWYFCRIAGVLLPLWIIGMVDDSRGIAASVRFLVQLAAAGLAVYWFGSLPGIDSLFDGLGVSWLSPLLSVVAIAAMINFYNFMDGLDGIVGGVSAVQLVFFASYLHQPLWSLLAAALIGFLHWNWPPAKIFMGDSGSTVLGGAAALALLQAPDASAMWCAAAVTVPLLGDATFTLLRRLIRRENVFEAHKSHIYQRLNQSGWSHGRVAITYIALTTAIAALITAFR